MTTLQLVLVSLAGALFAWALLVLALAAANRGTEARALARFLPDCLVLLRRLLADEHVPRSRKLVLVALLAYLLMPIDLVPDFIPVVGLVDDAIVAAIALRLALRSGGETLLREHWPGPEASLAIVIRVAYGRHVR